MPLIEEETDSKASPPAVRPQHENDVIPEANVDASPDGEKSASNGKEEKFEKEDEWVMGPPELVRNASVPGAFREGGSSSFTDPALSQSRSLELCPSYSNELPLHSGLQDCGPQQTVINAVLVGQDEEMPAEYVYAEPLQQESKVREKKRRWRSLLIIVVITSSLFALIIAVTIDIVRSRNQKDDDNVSSEDEEKYMASVPNTSTTLFPNTSTPTGGNSFNMGGKLRSIHAALWKFNTSCSSYKKQSMELFCIEGNLGIIDTFNATTCVILPSQTEAQCENSGPFGAVLFHCFSDDAEQFASVYYPHSVAENCDGSTGYTASVSLTLQRFCRSEESDRLTLKHSFPCEDGKRRGMFCSESATCECLDTECSNCSKQSEGTCRLELDDLQVSDEDDQCLLGQYASAGTNVDKLWAMVWDSLA